MVRAKRDTTMYLRAERGDLGLEEALASIIPEKLERARFTSLLSDAIAGRRFVWHWCGGGSNGKSTLERAVGHAHPGKVVRVPAGPGGAGPANARAFTVGGATVFEHNGAPPESGAEATAFDVTFV